MVSLNTVPSWRFCARRPAPTIDVSGIPQRRQLRQTWCNRFGHNFHVSTKIQIDIKKRPFLEEHRGIDDREGFAEASWNVWMTSRKRGAHKSVRFVSMESQCRLSNLVERGTREKRETHRFEMPCVTDLDLYEFQNLPSHRFLFSLADSLEAHAKPAKQHCTSSSHIFSYHQLPDLRYLEEFLQPSKSSKPPSTFCPPPCT